MSVAMTLADSVAYFLARVGRVHLTEKQSSVIQHVERAEEKRHWLPLAILAVWSVMIPLPNEVLLIPLGFLGYGAHRVLPIVFVGNVVFNTLVGYGLYGLAWY